MLSGNMSVRCYGLEIPHKNCDSASTWSSCRPRGNCVISIEKIVQPIGVPRHLHMAALDLSGLSVHPGPLVSLRFERDCSGEAQTDHRATPELATYPNLC